MREADPQLHRRSDIGHIEAEWERQCWFTVFPNRWRTMKGDRREALTLENRDIDRQAIEKMGCAGSGMLANVSIVLTKDR